MRALIGVAFAGFVLGLAALALVLTGDHDTITGPFVVLALTLGWSFIGTGLYARWRRPDSLIGRLMTIVGFLWFIGALPEADSALPYTVGLALGGLWAAPFVHLLVAFPTGQVKPGLERRVVWLGYGLALAQPIALLFAAEPYPDCNGCPENLLLMVDSPAAASLATALLGVAGVTMLAGVCVVLVRRWRRSGPVQRQALAPVLWTGAAVAVVGVASVIPQVAGAHRRDRRVRNGADRADHGGAVRVPGGPAALVGLACGRTRVADGARRHHQRARRAGRGARRPRPGARVLAAGPGPSTSTPTAIPPTCTSRAVTEIDHDGERLAAIVHDPALLEEPELVRAAGAAAALALRNERLDAELRARYEELRASRARLVAAGDDARRRIERDLHDGAQQHLVSLALTLRLARLATEDGTKAAKFLDAGIEALKQGLAELRELARGIHPAVLTERGLEAALDGLAARAPVPVTVTAELGDAPAARVRERGLLPRLRGAHERRQVRGRDHGRGLGRPVAAATS